MSLLTEIEEIGIKVQTLIRLGLLDRFTCSTCTEELKVERDCENDNLSSPIYAHELIGEFYACPKKFIPSSVISFFRQYDILEKYPSSAPQLHEFNQRYIESMFFYENFVHELKNIKSDAKTPIESDKMEKMRKLLNRG